MNISNSRQLFLWSTVRSRIACLMLLFSVSSVAFAADQKCVSPDRNFSSFLRRFQENTKFRLTRTVFPLAVASNTLGAPGVEQTQISALAARGDNWEAKIIVPPTQNDMERLLTAATPTLRGFDYHVTIGKDTASLSINNENEILSSQSYEFSKRHGCWFLTKVSHWAHS
jgi:hypothetical protein